jgi:'Cold-shock' DNA-binding domain
LGGPRALNPARPRMVSQVQGEVKRKGDLGAIIGGSNQHPALLEREDCTLMTWYRCFYAPRAEGCMTVSAVERAGLSTLIEGQHIEYEIEENRGKTSAVNLKVK